MKSYGVKLIRVPTGYWNWITLTDGTTPDCPEDVAKRYKNLQAVTAEQYQPYIDKIISYCKKYDMKFFFEMHGAPGSQNGSQASGCVTGSTNSNEVKPDHYFDSDANKQIALNTIGVMAQKCAKHWGHCYGVGVLNEPMPGENSPTSDDLHTFLDVYYGEAILEARKYLNADVPVILFSWKYDFLRWSDQHYPRSIYGNVVWDTHAYPGFAYKTVDEALDAYKSILNMTSDF